MATTNARDEVGLACEELFLAHDYVGAIDAAARALQVAPDDPRANYYAALLHRLARRDAASAAYLQRSGLAPGVDFDYMPFDWYAAKRLAFLAEQDRAIARQRPAMTIAALPKSASAYVTNFTAVALKMPSCRIATGAAVVPNWARQLARGGAINHEHFPGTPENVGALVGAGIGRVAVLLRDPRQQVVSMMHHHIKDQPEHELTKEVVAAAPHDQMRLMLAAGFLSRALDWIGGWVEQAERPGPALEIRFVTFEELVADAPAFFHALWQYFGIAAPVGSIAALMASAQGQAMRWNFRKGETDEWRGMADAETRAEMWRQLPPRLAKRFGWLE